MYAIKEALLAKSGTNGEAETVIFYMDMRTFGKSFQRYRDKAQGEYGVRFENARVHSVVPEDGTGNLLVRYVDTCGKIHEECFGMIVLATGQRPAQGTVELVGITGLSLNPWGFAETAPFSLTETSRPGISYRRFVFGTKRYKRIGYSGICRSCMCIKGYPCIRKRPDARIASGNGFT